MARSATRLAYFHERGWNVAATMRDPDAEHHLTTLGDVLVTLLDVTDSGSIGRAVDAALERFGGCCRPERNHG